MTRRIEVEVEGAKAEFELRDDLAPQTVAALWGSLPIETSIRHGKLSGSACFIDVEHGPIASIAADPELPVTSIYKGWIVAFPAPSMGFTELLISYGVAEYRWPTGRKLVTPVAELQGDGSALFDVLQRTHSEGEKSVAIRRSGE
jgi:Protein of unknown function (DUF3830)